MYLKRDDTWCIYVLRYDTAELQQNYNSVRSLKSSSRLEVADLFLPNLKKKRKRREVSDKDETARYFELASWRWLPYHTGNRVCTTGTDSMLYSTVPTKYKVSASSVLFIKTSD